MSTINVSIRQQHKFSHVPTQSAISLAVERMNDIADTEGSVQADIIEWYANTWSSFVRRGSTDFSAQEWVKRSFKPVAKDFETSIKNVNDAFDVKHKTYKNVKSVLSRAAYAMLSLEIEDYKGLRYKTLAELKAELKGKGTGESLSEMIERTCAALVPVDSDGVTKYTVEEYRDAYMTLNDPTKVTKAVEALMLVVGLPRMEGILLALVHAARGGKVLTDQGADAAQDAPGEPLSAAQVAADKELAYKQMREGTE